MTFKKIAVFTFLILFSIACNKKEDIALTQKDLLEYGIPLTVNIPVDAKITKGNAGLIPEVYIEDSTSYFNIQINTLPATTTDVTKVKAEIMGEVKIAPYFTKLVQEDRDGFIYETTVDSTAISYHFKHCVVQGDNTYIFENSLISQPSLEEAQFMYETVRK